MRKTFIWFMPILLMGLTIYSCTPKAEYDRKLKQELASGIRYDSLFLGIRLGMTDREFYKHCWNLNKQGLIKQGTSNTSVEYQLKTELKYPVKVDFYPKFVDGKIAEMPVTFIYTGWAPWNKELTSDKLQQAVLKYYDKIYGTDFMKVEHPTRGFAYVKIDGNRRISIFKQDEMRVWAVFTDMTVKKEEADTTKSANNPANNTKDLK